MIRISLLLLILVSTPFFSQEKDKGRKPKISNKGKLYIYWGWNGASYSNSDITFKGGNYNFTLQDVVAKDRQSPFSFKDYFNPAYITYPQTNFKLGYFLNDNYTISVGVDHMKYVVEPDQIVQINGEINAGTAFDGIYMNDDISLIEEFLLFEHTDGLNYINLEVKRFDEIGYLIGMNSEKLQLNVTEGIGSGIIYPKTNTTLLNRERYDEFNLAGWGISMTAGLNLTFFKHFFIQTDVKYGYINMPNIRTTMSLEDSASQSFTFFEKTFVFGARFNIFKNK